MTTLLAPQIKELPHIAQYVYSKPKFRKDGRPHNLRRKIGLLIATEDGIGWSRCMKTDKFDRNEAYKIAVERIGNEENLPHSFQDAYEKFLPRVNKYFKKNNQ